jgi:hypothetical protein
MSLGRVPVGDPAQASVPVKRHSLPYVNVYRNVRQVPVLPTSVDTKPLVYVADPSVLGGPQNVPQLPLVSSVVPPLYTNAPQVSSAFEYPNVSAPKVPIFAR